jgi:hypothetical protein
MTRYIFRILSFLLIAWVVLSQIYLFIYEANPVREFKLNYHQLPIQALNYLKKSGQNGDERGLIVNLDSTRLSYVDYGIYRNTSILFTTPNFFELFINGKKYLIRTNLGYTPYIYFNDTIFISNTPGRPVNPPESEEFSIIVLR